MVSWELEFGNPVMPKIVDHRNRTPEDIVTRDLEFDSMGYLYRSISWLDYFERTDRVPAFFYACMEGRYAIEQLLFEQLVIGTGANLLRSDYETCLKNSSNLSKMIDRLVPDFLKLQEFTSVVIELDSNLPQVIFWKPKELMKSWGRLSTYLHWVGANRETTENTRWKQDALNNVKAILMPIWDQYNSAGGSGIMHFDDMQPEVNQIWQDFKEDKIGLESVRIRMKIVQPRLQQKLAWSLGQNDDYSS